MQLRLLLLLQSHVHVMGGTIPQRSCHVPISDKTLHVMSLLVTKRTSHYLLLLVFAEYLPLTIAHCQLVQAV